MDEDTFKDREIDHSPRQTLPAAGQMINWIPIKEIGNSNLEEWQKVLATDGKMVQVYGFMVLKHRHEMGATNITHYAVITLPNGAAA